MAMQQSEGMGLLAKLGAELVAAQAEVQGMEPQYDEGGSLPAGIENGIAQLKDIKIGVYKDGKNIGKSFFLATGVVVEPKVFNGIPIENRQTKIGPEPLCNTPMAAGNKKTLKDHYSWMMNELMILGLTDYIHSLQAVVPGETTDAAAKRIEAGVYRGIELLKQQKPYFRFRTWKGKDTEIVNQSGKWFAVQGDKKIGGPYPSEQAAKTKHPYAGQASMTNQVWQGECEYNPASDLEVSTAGMEDNTAAPAAHVAGRGTGIPAPESDYPGGSFPVDMDVPADGEGNSEPEALHLFPQGPEPGSIKDTPMKMEVRTLEEMAAIADASATPGQTPEASAIQSAATAAGVSEQEAEDTHNWVELVALIRKAEAAKAAPPPIPAAQTAANGAPPPSPPTTAAAAPAAPEPPPPPTVGGAVKYQLRDDKGAVLLDKNKKPRKPVNCEVLLVDAKTGRANIRAMNGDKTVYKAVPWGDLLPA